MGVLTSSFFQREDIWYFVPNEIIGFQLVGRERKELSGRIVLQLAANLLLGFLTLALGQDSWKQWLSPGAVSTPLWMPHPDFLYAIIAVAWLLCWANSVVLWRTVRQRLAKRETRIAQELKKSGFLRCTKPYQTALIGLFVVGFLTQGYGSVCPYRDKAPICATIDRVLDLRVW